MHPQTINQGSNGTCGAAVLRKMLAEISPSDLVNAAVSLFDNGTYKQWGWTISDDMKRCSKQQLNEIGINEVEAMIQTGIINGNNKYLQYSANTDNQGNEDFLNKKYDGLKSFMWHTYIRDFMSSIYPEKFIERTTSPSYETIKLIDYAKEFVIAAVDCIGSNFVNSLVPTHYVQINSVGGKDSKDNFIIEYWNYGTMDKSYNNSHTYINYLYRIRR